MATEAASKKEEQSARSRARLVDAATRLFAERGYRDTSVQAIGEAAGISRGSVFWHFGSKEGLLWAVVAQAFERWEVDVLLPDVGGARGMEAVRRALRSHRRFLTEDTEALRLFYVLMFEALGPRPELAGRFAELHVHLRALGVDWVRQSRGRRGADLDPSATVTIICAALGGIAYQHLLDPRALDLDRIYADLERILERGVAS